MILKRKPFRNVDGDTTDVRLAFSWLHVQLLQFKVSGSQRRLHDFPLLKARPAALVDLGFCLEFAHDSCAVLDLQTQDVSVSPRERPICIRREHNCLILIHKCTNVCVVLHTCPLLFLLSSRRGSLCPHRVFLFYKSVPWLICEPKLKILFFFCKACIIFPPPLEPGVSIFCCRKSTQVQMYYSSKE